jgi:holo-[acyl-carrier protein] synthase
MKTSSLLVGIDLVEVRRVDDSLKRFGPRYVNRLFTENEIKYCCAARATAPERFAARFAAKEATLKVLRPGDQGIDWRAIEVRRSPEGACDLVLHGSARALAQKSGIASLALSMSHDAGWATAVVIAERKQAKRRARGRGRRT